MTWRDTGRQRLVAASLLIAGCSVHLPVRALPPAGQIADDYRLEPARALVIAHVDVITGGQPGFGPIANPLYIELDQGDGSRGHAAELAIADPRDRFFTSEAHRPALWQYASPGLLVMAVPPGTYDAMVIGYPDTSRLDRPADSIPVPNRPMRFAPVRLLPDTLTYLGDVEITQTFSWADLILDRIDVDYAIVDRCERTTADFRARYPQFGNAAVEKALLVPTTGDG